MEEFDHLQSRFISKFNEFVQNGGYHWKSQEELAELTGIPISKVECIIMFSGEFVENSEGYVTMRKYYESRTPLLKKIKDSFLGMIV
jgi:hypothetical protein